MSRDNADTLYYHLPPTGQSLIPYNYKYLEENCKIKSRTDSLAECQLKSQLAAQCQQEYSFLDIQPQLYFSSDPKNTKPTVLLSK